MEVQAALSLAPVELRLHTSALTDVLARLDAQRERQGPRALVFELEPGQPARVVVQPWGISTKSDPSPTAAASLDPSRWGRRRLRSCASCFPATELTVRLVDSGMPSFWSIELEASASRSGSLVGPLRTGQAEHAFPHSPRLREAMRKRRTAAELLQRQHCLSVDGLAGP